MEYLHHWLEHASTPFWSAIILGLMTTISPCPLATNITAIGYLGRYLNTPNLIFKGGFFYTLGRIVAYSLLGILLSLGIGRFQMAKIFQIWGEKLIGFFLIGIGIIMLDWFRFKIPWIDQIINNIAQKQKHNFWGAFSLGLIFALAFCPYSGMLFFGILVPLTIKTHTGLFLPVIYALATGIPIILLAWILAYSLKNLGKIYQNILFFEIWFRRVVAMVFLLAGLYYIWTIFIKPILL